jgi:hypothetical protein
MDESINARSQSRELLADSFFWHYLGREFSALRERLGDLTAEWENVTETSPEHEIEFLEVTPAPSIDSWSLSAPSVAARLEFKALALKAGDALSKNDCVDAVAVWLDTLRSENLNHVEHPPSMESLDDQDDDGPAHFRRSGAISNLCEASAILCKALEIKELNVERIARAAAAEKRRRDSIAGPLPGPTPVPTVEPALTPERGISSQQETSPKPETLPGRELHHARVTSAPARVDRRSVLDPLLNLKGWSVNDWANAAHVSHATAMDYLLGKTDPYPSTRKKLADALAIQISQLPD